VYGSCSGSTQPHPTSHRYVTRLPEDFCPCGCSKPIIFQRTYQAQQQSMEPPTIIYFSVLGQCGISIVDALAHRFSGLERRDDAVFANISCGVSITLRFEVCLHLAKLRSRIDVVKVVRLPIMGCSGTYFLQCLCTLHFSPRLLDLDQRLA